MPEGCLLPDNFHPPSGSAWCGLLNLAKGLDRLAVRTVDSPPWPFLPAGEHAPFFMGASRVRQPLAMVGRAHVDDVGIAAC